MQIKITNPDKILFPKDNIKKIDIIEYYANISDLMLPFIKNRLLSVIRCHDNINEECFFKKHPTTDKNYVEIFEDDEAKYFYIRNKSQLVYQAQFGTIEFHAWGSTLPKINTPDFMVFDLDPDEKLPLSKVRDAVLYLKSVLDELNLFSFLKTSGGKGYHLVIPFKKTKDWNFFYDFSKQIALIAEGNWPKIFTTNIRKSERKGKIFVDYLRNNRASTCIAPYSLRARAGACISMPISWSDLNYIKPNEVNVKNYKDYVNDSWQSFFTINQSLK